MRLDLTVNLFTMQALMNGVITVHGGQQYRPSIHIDDMTDLYLFMLEHPELTGIYNAGFENHKLIDIADTIQHATGARVEVTDQKDARSYQVNSDKLLATGFRPKKNIGNAIAELTAAYHAGTLKNEPQWTNLTWMQHLGIRDE
jgi:nucleoside-diphosphate-sugar epimerase